MTLCTAASLAGPLSEPPGTARGRRNAPRCCTSGTSWRSMSQPGQSSRRLNVIWWTRTDERGHHFERPRLWRRRRPRRTGTRRGIRRILVNTAAEDQSNFQRLLDDGARFGTALSYAVQLRPDGVPQASMIHESFISSAKLCLALGGDSIFYGQGFSLELHEAARQEGAQRCSGARSRDPSTLVSSSSLANAVCFPLRRNSAPPLELRGHRAVFLRRSGRRFG